MNPKYTYNALILALPLLSRTFLSIETASIESEIKERGREGMGEREGGWRVTYKSTIFFKVSIFSAKV